jgi:hypothetical protein
MNCVFCEVYTTVPIPEQVRSHKARYCCLSFAEIVDSKSGVVMDGSMSVLSAVCCQLKVSALG